MEMKVQVPLQSLLSLVKNLTPAQKQQLRRELDAAAPLFRDKDEFLDHLLKGTVYCNKEIKVFEENRKRIAA